MVFFPKIARKGLMPLRCINEVEALLCLLVIVAESWGLDDIVFS
jgi:hypothetical protein